MTHEGGWGFELSRSGTSVTVVIHGDFDAARADEVRRVLTALVNGGCDELVVDGHDIEFVDSTALGVLVGAMKRVAQRHRGRFVLRDPSTPVQRVLHVCGLTGLLHEQYTAPAGSVAKRGGALGASPSRTTAS